MTASCFSFGIFRDPGAYSGYGGVCMCRKNHLHGCCLGCLGFGLLAGHCLESWLLCCFGGLVLMGLGLCVIRRR